MSLLWYRMLLPAADSGRTTQAALDGARNLGRLTTAEHADLSARLETALNPPPPPPPVTVPLDPDPVPPTPDEPAQAPAPEVVAGEAASQGEAPQSPPT